MKEIIKPISNYDGYFISNLGKVYCNIGRGGKNTNRKELYEIKPRQTEVLNHIIRDEKGLFVSNFKYEI